MFFKYNLGYIFNKFIFNLYLNKKINTINSNTKLAKSPLSLVIKYFNKKIRNTKKNYNQIKNNLNTINNRNINFNTNKFKNNISLNNFDL